MVNILQEAESYLDETLEGDLGMSITLIGPTGATQTVNGVISWETITQDLDGNEVMDDKPVITVRLSSLDPIPADGEKWAVRIPDGPREDAETKTYLIHGASKGGRATGMRRFYLREAEQS